MKSYSSIPFKLFILYIYIFFLNFKIIFETNSIKIIRMFQLMQFKIVALCFICMLFIFSNAQGTASTDNYSDASTDNATIVTITSNTTISSTTANNSNSAGGFSGNFQQQSIIIPISIISTILIPLLIGYT